VDFALLGVEAGSHCDFTEYFAGENHALTADSNYEDVSRRIAAHHPFLSVFSPEKEPWTLRLNFFC